MVLLVASFIFASTIFSSNLSVNFLDQAFEQPISFIRSLFISSPLPVQTKDSKSYTIALIGDSMTEVMGSADDLRKDLKSFYPDKEFGILNFGIGSTSILSVPDQLNEESKRGPETLPPILSTRPDVIILESFGNNPLSHMSLDKGLKKQKETLDQIVHIIKNKSPNTVLIFVATISPSKERYAEGVVNLLSEQRKQWSEERIAYMKNHISYAKLHHIPLVNVYEESLDEKGDGRQDYLDAGNFIHPSRQGILFISQQIADVISKEKIIPN